MDFISNIRQNQFICRIGDPVEIARNTDERFITILESTRYEFYGAAIYYNSRIHKIRILWSSDPHR